MKWSPVAGFYTLADGVGYDTVKPSNTVTSHRFQVAGGLYVFEKVRTATSNPYRHAIKDFINFMTLWLSHNLTL